MILLVLSVTASVTSIPWWVILAFGIATVAVGSYVSYSKQRTLETIRLLSELKGVLEDFFNCCFQARGTSDDFRIIKLLERLTFSSATEISQEQGDLRTGFLRNFQEIYQSWFSTLDTQVQIMKLNAKTLANKHYMIKTSNDFTILYNDYYDRVILGVVDLVKKAEYGERGLLLSAFAAFKDNLSNVRQRGNRFLKEVNEAGYSLQGSELRALTIDLTHAP